MESHDIGRMTFARVSNSAELKQVLKDPWLQSETIIIKPNWVTTEPAGFTSSDTIRMFVEALDSHIIVTESLHLGRSMNLLKKGLSFIVGDKEVNWDWLLKGEGWRWLNDNPDWQWFREEGHWDQILKEDKNFLDLYGFTDLFQDYDIEYVNVTDELWKKRIADPTEVKKLVESRYNPVQIEKMYEFVPTKLYEHRDATFISLARLKQYATFTLKNMFGLIPDPMRPWWHGPKNSRIATSIVDINKIYHSVFNVYGICASLKKTASPDTEGEYKAEYLGRYKIVDGFGFIAMSRDLVSLDSTLLTLSEEITERAESVNVKPIKLAEKEGLGKENKDDIQAAKRILGHWMTKP